LMEAPPGMTERFFVAVEPLERKAGSGYGPRNSQGQHQGRAGRGSWSRQARQRRPQGGNPRGSEAAWLRGGQGQCPGRVGRVARAPLAGITNPRNLGRGPKGFRPFRFLPLFTRVRGRKQRVEEHPTCPPLNPSQGLNTPLLHSVLALVSRCWTLFWATLSEASSSTPPTVWPLTMAAHSGRVS
jgi:hypothetical protein